jgi:hypothetical protein
MEALVNFIQAQTVYGLLAVLSFACILILQLRDLIKARKPSLLRCIAVTAPLLFAVIAATIHLDAVRGVIESDAADIVNPAAGIQLAIEIMWGGVILSFFLALIPMWFAFKSKQCS